MNIIKIIKKLLFKWRLKSFIKRTKVGTIAEAHHIVVSRAIDFNLEKDNDVWDLEEHKSELRDLNCFKCAFQVVMSNGLYKNYQKNPTPEKILCARCLLEDLKCEVLK